MDIKSEDLAIYDLRILWRHMKTSNKYYSTCVDCEAYIGHSRWEQSISGFDYIIIFFVVAFNFADVTENGILHWNIQFPFCVFFPFAIVIQEIHGKDSFNKRKQEIIKSHIKRRSERTF